MKSILFIFLFAIFCLTAQANDERILNESFSSLEQELNLEKPKPIRSLFWRLRMKKRMESNPRATAAVLTLALGPFGGHRIYLGTHYSVPIFYTVTIGGGMGILPVSDLLLILFSKDISNFYDNEHVFMWQ